MKGKSRLLLAVLIILLLPELMGCNEETIQISEDDEIAVSAEAEGLTIVVTEEASAGSEVYEEAVVDEEGDSLPVETEEPNAPPSEEPVETVEDVDPSESEPYPLFAVDFNTWDPLDHTSPSYIEEISAADGILEIKLDKSAVQGDTPLSVFVDFMGPDLPLIDSPADSYRGANYGTADILQDNSLQSRAAVVVPNPGEVVPLSSTVEVVVEGNLYVLMISGADVPSGEESMRIFITEDGELCFSLGEPAVNDAYILGAELDPTVGDFLAARDGIPVCTLLTNTCLFVPQDIQFERTGDLTFDITIDGVVYTVQFDVTAGTFDIRLDEYTQAGWITTNVSDYETEFATWNMIELFFNGESRGYLALRDNGNQDNPITFAVSVIGENPFTETTVEPLFKTFGGFLDTFRNGNE